MVAVVVEHAAKGCTILGRRVFREKKNRGCVRGNKIVSVLDELCLPVFLYFG